MIADSDLYLEVGVLRYEAGVNEFSWVYFVGLFGIRLERGSIGCDRNYGDQRRFVDNKFLRSWTLPRGCFLIFKGKYL